MIKKVLSVALLATLAQTAQAQYSEFLENAGANTKYTLNSDNNILQLGGRVSGYYENRLLKAGQLSKDKNGWDVKDFDLNLIGKNVNKFVYEIHLSVIDLVRASATLNEDGPDKSGIKSAYVSYRGWPVNIKFGFDKLPYSQGSISDVWSTPYWSHADIYTGDLFSRRDFGLTLDYRCMKEKLHFYAGAYSGMGENFFQTGNDASGTFEYIARAEYSYPGKMKYHIIDNEHVEKINFRVAANARYADKHQPAGEVIGADVPGIYGIKVIDGKRLGYGFDAIVKYKGFSAIAEAQFMKLQPVSQSNGLYNGTTEAVNQNHINAGGFVLGANYDYTPWKSTLSLMYEDFNANDLVDGSQKWINIGYAYKISGYQSVFKLHYYIPTVEDLASRPLKYTSMFRIGFQQVF